MESVDQTETNRINSSSKMTNQAESGDESNQEPLMRLFRAGWSSIYNRDSVVITVLKKARLLLESFQVESKQEAALWRPTHNLAKWRIFLNEMFVRSVDQTDTVIEVTTMCRSSAISKADETFLKLTVESFHPLQWPTAKGLPWTNGIKLEKRCLTCDQVLQIEKPCWVGNEFKNGGVRQCK